MSRLISPGVYTLVLVLIAGLWIVVSPFVMRLQPAGASWINWTVNDVAVGGILIITSLIGIVGHVAFGLRELVQTAARQAEDSQSEPPS